MGAPVKVVPKQKAYYDNFDAVFGKKSEQPTVGARQQVLAQWASLTDQQRTELADVGIRNPDDVDTFLDAFETMVVCCDAFYSLYVKEG